MTTNGSLKLHHDIKSTEEEIAAAFPDIDPGFEPFGSRVIVQLRRAQTKTKSGIYLVPETVEIEKWNTQIGKVRALGPLSFKNRDKAEAWPEGNWCAIGDYVRIPKFNQDKWTIPDGDYEVLFMLINDIDLLAKKTGNPLEVKAYL